jgi:signal transduction histidine kinase
MVDLGRTSAERGRKIGLADLGAFALLVASLISPLPAAADSLPRSVLYIEQTDPGTPFSAAVAVSFRSTLEANNGKHVEIYWENLDIPRFAGEQYQALQRSYIMERHRKTPIGIIVAVGSLALDFALRLRTKQWPAVPIVFGAVDEDAAARYVGQTDVTGLLLRLRLSDSVIAARTLVPGLRRVAVVGDSFDVQAYRRHFKDELPVIAREVEVIDLTGLPIVEVKRRVAVLPQDAAIIYTTIYANETGFTTARASLASLAEVANRPIVFQAETHSGYGGTGGLVISPGVIGRETARPAVRVLDGARASDIPVTFGNFTKPVFDWRQLRRWGVDTNRLPPESELQFREPSIWDEYRSHIVLVAVALMLQTALIVGLFVERRRRRRAEVEVRTTMSELAHMNRVATAGELSASFAHEISQPIGAITANSNAAMRWLAKATPDLDEARAALTRVVGEGHRAAELIVGIRSMFKKDGQRRAPLDVNELIRAALVISQGEAKKHQVTIKTDLFSEIPQVSGDRIQLQQVILNLVMNAIEAMDTVIDRERLLAVKSEIQNSDLVVITVKDSGPSIDPKDVDRIFKAFFTTKSRGMGMGLSICRSIIDAHSGSLSVSPGNPHGAIFQVALRTSAPPPATS